MSLERVTEPMRTPGRNASRTRRGRSPGFVYSGLSAALVVALAALTITAAQTPPPAIAELAPQAVQQIKDAPQEQSSELGSAEGGGGLGGLPPPTTTTTAAAPAGGPGAPTTTTTEPLVERARVRRCVGNPPRQTEDPQSPPCVPYWSGDNGGATYQGVTAETITIALPHGSERTAQNLEAYFNKRFEFYGRQIDLVSAGGGNTCTERKSAAVEIDEEIGAFGALNASYGNAGPCLTAELARRKLMSVSNIGEFSETPTSRDLAPYLWQYMIAQDRLFATMGEVACKRLAGENAIYSTDPLVQAKKRKFGVILQHVIRDIDVDLAPLHRELAKCGEQAFTFKYTPNNDDPGVFDPSIATQAVLQMQREGVTTVVCLCIVFLEQYLPGEATRQNYYPEWMFSSYGANDLNIAMKAFWPDVRQRQAVFGVGIRAPMRPWDREPSWWAVKEVDPTITNEANRGDVDEFHVQYQAMLLMASGIQMAGPNLTPETFEAALHRTVFANATDYPDTSNPVNSGTVGFLDRDHSMTNDAIEYWWSETAPSPNGWQTEGSPGAFCYVDRAARRTPGRWPTEKNPFFRGPCYSSA